MKVLNNLRQVAVMAVMVMAAAGFQTARADINAEPVIGANFIQMESNYPEKYKSQLTAVFLDETRATVRSFLYTDNQNTNKECTVEEMRKGVVLLRALNKDMVRVDAPNFDPERGGTVQLTFYRTFFGSDRRVVTFEFSREADGSWIVFYPVVSQRTLFDTLRTTVVTNGLGMPTKIDKVDLKLEGKVVQHFETEDLPKPKSWKRFAGRPFLLGLEVN